MEPLISQEIRPANRFLWAVRCYLDLISRGDRLVSGAGLKRLWVLQAGIATLNDDEIEKITQKAERENIIPQSLYGFMQKAICTNCYLYGVELQRVIYERIIDISNGDVRNPEPTFKFSSDEARRFYYTPPFQYIERILRALREDRGQSGEGLGRGAPTKIQDVANEGDILLTHMQITEGHMTPTETTWGAVVTVVEGLIGVLMTEMVGTDPDLDYRNRARGALKILFVLTKILMADLSSQPLSKEINLVDLDRKLSFTDGTLASIPFPLQQTIRVFSDQDHSGMSLKGRMYISAVSGAAFHRVEASSVE